MSTQPADIDVAAAADALADLEEQAAALGQRISALKAVILAATPPGATVTGSAGRPLWRVVPGKRTFKPDKAAEVLPPEIAAACTKPVIDPKEVKHLSTAWWEACCTTAAPYLQAVK
jgi:hypothetical protein